MPRHKHLGTKKKGWGIYYWQVVITADIEGGGARQKTRRGSFGEGRGRDIYEYRDQKGKIGES